MPGKVNPVIAESVLMVCAQVIGYDATIAWCGAAGNFELNVMMPVMAYDLLESIELLAAAIAQFRRAAGGRLEADRERARRLRRAVAGHGDGAGSGDRLREGRRAGEGGVSDGENGARGGAGEERHPGRAVEGVARPGTPSRRLIRPDMCGAHTCDTVKTSVMNYYQENRQAFLEGLKTFLRIPSISTLSEHKPDIRRAAEFVRDELRARPDCSTRRADRRRGQSAGLRASGLGAPGKPTLLLYGHYDVQPPDPLDEWKSPPFEPDVRGDDIFARGSSDDKGQTYILIKAVEGLLKTTGKLPVNVKFLIEGEEEIGGEHIEAYVASKPAAPEGRRRGDLRYRDVRARAAHHLRRAARHRLRRAARGRRQSRSALGRLRRRGAQSACRPSRRF